MILQNRIKAYFDEAVVFDYDGQSNAHPIIALNALKNIIGDDRQNVSQKLLDAMEKLTEKHPQRTDDKTIIDAVVKKGLGLTVFIAELEDACQSGNPIEMEQEAARLQWVSENGLAGINCLLELALQDFDRLGSLVYHLQRANAFNQDIKNTWVYTRCLLKEICKEPLPDPHDKVDHGLSVMDQIPENNSQSSKMAAAKRLWDGEYVRIQGYRREISHWFSNQEEGNASDYDKNIINGLEDYFYNGGNFFIELAENLTDYPQKIVFLEALRYWTKNKQISNLPSISNHISDLIT
jgi:hypothetical protein